MGWNDRGSLKMRILATSPTSKRQWMSMFSRPVAGSRRIQVTFFSDDRKFIIGITSLNSTGGLYSVSMAIRFTMIPGSSPTLALITISWSTGRSNCLR